MGFTSFHNDHGLLGGLSDDDHTQYVLGNILTTDGDLFSRNAGAVTRIAAVATGQVLASAGVSTLSAWSASPSLTALTLSSALNLPDGTVSAAALAFEVDTGVFQPADDSVGVVIGGTEVARFVNITLNQTKLLVGATAVIAGVTQDVRISGSAATTDFIVDNTGTGAPRGVMIVTPGTGAARRVSWNTGNSAHLIIGVNGVDIMKIEAGTGNILLDPNDDGYLVGIGTASPVISGTGNLHMAADTFRLATARTPASAGAAGNAGDICWDASYIYVCTATNAWERVAIASW